MRVQRGTTFQVQKDKINSTLNFLARALRMDPGCCKSRRQLKKVVCFPWRPLGNSSIGKGKKSTLKSWFPPVLLSTLDINFVILTSHSGHITCHSITSCFLTVPVGVLISVKCWRSLSNGHTLFLSVCHWCLMPKGHEGTLSYFRDQSSTLMTRNCCSPWVQTGWETCSFSKVSFIYWSSS